MQEQETEEFLLTFSWIHTVRKEGINVVKFKGKAEEKELGGDRVQKAQRNKELESTGGGNVGVHA